MFLKSLEARAIIHECSRVSVQTKPPNTTRFPTFTGTLYCTKTNPGSVSLSAGNLILLVTIGLQAFGIFLSRPLLPQAFCCSLSMARVNLTWIFRLHLFERQAEVHMKHFHHVADKLPSGGKQIALREPCQFRFNQDRQVFK